MAMAAATAERDVLVPSLEEKHEDPPKKQKKTDEEKQEKVSDDDDDDFQCLPGEAPEMTRAELVLYHQQVYESGVNNHQI